MTIWTNEQLRQVFKDGAVTPFDESRIKQAAYELGVSEHYVVTTPEGEGARVRVPLGDDIKIPAGHFALLLTSEIVNIPPNAMGFISVKAGLKLKGLVNVSGFHVDPGYNGRLKFSVYNANGKPLHIHPGRPIFQLWLNALGERLPEDKLYPNRHPPDTGILDDDVTAIGGLVASPAGLSARIDELRERLTREIPELGIAMQKTIGECSQELLLQLNKEAKDIGIKIEKESKELAVKIENIKTQQRFQWYFIIGLYALVVGAPLNDCIKERKNSSSHNSAATSLQSMDAGAQTGPVDAHALGVMLDGASAP